VFINLTYRVPGATIVMAAALLTLFLQREHFRAPTFLGLFVASMMWAILGYAVTPYPDVVWPALVDYLKVILVTLVAVNALRTATQVRYCMLFVLVSYVLFPVRSALTNYLLGYRLAGRITGSFVYQNPNDLASLTILVLGLALALWTSEPHRRLVRWIGLASVAPLTLTIALTQSRGAFVGLGAVAIPSGVALARQRPRVAFGLAALIGLALYLAPAGLWQRLAGLGKATSAETIGEMDPEGSAQQRLAVLQTAARIIEDRPLLGVGLGAYHQANRDYNPALGSLDAHNAYMRVAAETGLPGLVLFLALLGSVVRTAYLARRRVGLASPAQAETLRWLLIGLIAHLITGLFRSFSLTFPYVYLALLWSASQVIGVQHQPASPAPTPPIQSDRATTPVDRSF
jgi:O-antigen ligase